MSSLYRPLAIVGYLAIGILALLQIVAPAAVAGIPASTIVGVTMTTVLTWGAIVGVAYKARWTASGFVVLATVFAIQTFSGHGVQSELLIYSVVSIAVLVIIVGGHRDDPTPPLGSRSS